MAFSRLTPFLFSLKVDLPGVSWVLFDGTVGALEFVSRIGGEFVEGVPGYAVPTGQLERWVRIRSLLTKDRTSKNRVVPESQSNWILSDWFGTCKIVH